MLKSECLECLYSDRCTPADQIQYISLVAEEDNPLDLDIYFGDDEQEWFIWNNISYRKYIENILDFVYDEYADGEWNWDDDRILDREWNYL